MTLEIDLVRALREPEYRDEISIELESNITDMTMLEAADEIDRLRSALAVSRTALSDWVATYASDMCAEKDVKESWARIGKQGGTLAYIAAVQEANTAALNTPDREG